MIEHAKYTYSIISVLEKGFNNCIAHPQSSISSMGHPPRNYIVGNRYISMEHYERYINLYCMLPGYVTNYFLQLVGRKRLLGSITVCLGDLKLTLEQVMDDPSLTLLCSEVELADKVDVYSAVMGKNSVLINSGDFVKFSDGGPSAMVC